MCKVNDSISIVPLHLWVGDKDYLAYEKDVDKLAIVLPNVQSYNLVEYQGFTHFDFAIAIDADKLVYSKILKQINESDK